MQGPPIGDLLFIDNLIIFSQPAFFDVNTEDGFAELVGKITILNDDFEILDNFMGDVDARSIGATLLVKQNSLDFLELLYDNWKSVGSERQVKIGRLALLNGQVIGVDHDAFVPVDGVGESRSVAFAALGETIAVKYDATTSLVYGRMCSYDHFYADESCKPC